MQKYLKEIDEIILNAFKEDIGDGDITTLATIEHNARGKAQFLLKEDGIIAGLDVVERVFQLYDSELKFEKFTNDGEFCNKGEVIATIKGKASSILTTERTALNFLQRMSGIATYSVQFANLIMHTKAQIIDTRKTAPGLRLLDKLAVVQGCCKNHRMGLYDMFLIKDNHIAAAGSISNAVQSCRKWMEEKLPGKSIKIEVETTNLEQVKEALENNVDVIMLDNFDVSSMKEAVAFINGKTSVEASGGVNLTSVKAIAETGVDFISVGAITHSVKALDISLNLTLEKII